MTTYASQLMTGTVTLSDQIIDGVSHVGKIVTYQGGQYTVHSVEGSDWYAFNRDGQTVLDFYGPDATAHNISSPQATIVPMGHTIGEGLSTTVHLRNCKRGVSLSKSYR